MLEDNSDRKLEHKKTTKHKYYKKLHRYVLFEKEKDKKKKKTLDKTWCRLTDPLVWVQVLVGTNTFKSWCSVSMV